MPTLQFSPGSLVRARGREWVVLPDSSPEFLLLQPLGGSAGEVAGIYQPGILEPVEDATFALPDPSGVGDARSSRLLREAARLGFRSGAGPFRCFGRIAVEPRPYQLVPLLLALQLDPIRLLIADDVGIGKTVEAALIARELLDRGEIKRIAVLCPPHLAEQWVTELREKFHLEAVAVLPSTAARLEAPCRTGESIFDHYPVTVVSLDFIKADRRREEFLARCPEMVIVDEAHTCAQSEGNLRQQRHKLLAAIASRPNQHLILVSATPHSGNAEAFRSLLALLNSQFKLLPDDLSGTANAAKRKELARHLVQRRRADIKDFLDADTPFPDREERELEYELTNEYKKFFNRVLTYARESVLDETGGHFRQRVRWWAALGLLRALASSPAAAAATLRARARNLGATTVQEADELGRRGVLDLAEDSAVEAADLAPGARLDEGEAAATSTGAATLEGENTRRLLDMAAEADRLRGAPDNKLQLAESEIRKLLNSGFSPIVFCRFIDTAEDLAKHLKGKLKGVEVTAITGLMAPDEREAAVIELANATADGNRRVLVATDCLSEGINLQAYFDAVLHYDLPWNPTRLEQREGRVDRYGQKSPTVRALTLWGKDNQIDGIVLEVLLKKHRQIRKALGISVPVPVDSDALVEAIFNGLLLRGNVSTAQMSLFDDLVEKKALDTEWDAATEREKRSRTVFSHEGIKADDVALEVNAMRQALGGAPEVERFLRETLAAMNVSVSDSIPAKIDLNSLPPAIEEPLRTSLPTATWKAGTLKARFDTANAAGETLVGRTHPLVATLAAYLLETALDSQGTQPLASRCGAMRTSAVEKRTTLLLVRGRFHLQHKFKGETRTMLAEDCALLAFRGAPDEAEWLSDAEAEALLEAVPGGNIAPEQAANFISRVIEGYDQLTPELEAFAHRRAEALLEAHRRVRAATNASGATTVQPQLPADLLGIWVYLPVL